MVITYMGGECFKVSQGDLTIALNPPSKDSSLKTSKFGSDIVLSSLDHEDMRGIENASFGDREPFAIVGPGEYEVRGVAVRGFGSQSNYGGESQINTIYSIALEGMNLCFLGALGSTDLPVTAKQELDDIDILFVRNISTEMRESVPRLRDVGYHRAPCPTCATASSPCTAASSTPCTAWVSPQARFRKSATCGGRCARQVPPARRRVVYDAMVKMAQDFSMRYPLILGQGNFGSIDGDSAAAMRYTEAKMSRMARSFCATSKRHVNWRPNYDGTLKEPEVLPAACQTFCSTARSASPSVWRPTSRRTTWARFQRAHAFDRKPDATVEDLMQFVTGPDFPTGAVAFNKKDLLHAYSTGKGGVVVRGNAEIVEGKKGDFQIVITSIPYRVNKADLIMRIADLVRDKKLEGIRGLRDESTKDIRVVVELKQGAHPQKVLNYLYKHTALEDTFHFNMVVLVDGVPQTLSLKGILQEFIKHRQEVVRRRTQFDLTKAQEREHILLGLKKALDHIDEIIKTIRASARCARGAQKLDEKFKF
jgi:hypothetical protein